MKIVQIIPIKFYSLPLKNVFGIKEYGKCRYDNECLGDLRVAIRIFLELDIVNSRQTPPIYLDYILDFSF